MTQAFGIFQHINSMSVIWLHRLAALLWPQKHLYTDRFATRAEIQTLAHETSYGLVLGVDASGQTLSVEATEKRLHLEHLAIFGPTGSGKTRREIRQLKKWKGSVIVNDPKCDLSNETADFRKRFSRVSAISGDLLSAVISIRYILGFRKDNPNVFNMLVQNLPHC
jgi:type IV secretory pathway TraG/TraD family ATPase VirD4